MTTWGLRHGRGAKSQALDYAKAVVLFLTLLFLACSLSGQTITGSISGSVKDSSNLAIVGASATLISTATTAEITVTSNEQGDFTFAAVEPGTYTLRLKYQGFKTLERPALILSASEHLALGALALEVGSAEQTITVTAEGARVETGSSERSAQLTASQIDNLEVKGRNITSMMKLMPGVVDTSEGSSTLSGGMNNSEDQIAKYYYFSVQGMRLNSTNVTLDGVSINDNSSNAEVNVAIGLDSVSEVKALLGNYPAEYGRMAGAQIQLIAKSGTHDFHGFGSYYLRNDDLNANAFFNNRLNVPRPMYRYNVLNYGIGGPLYIPGHLNKNRNKLFFFWTEEFWPIKNTNTLQSVTVPTALERQGNFSQSVNGSNQLYVVTDPTTGAPFPGNIVPTNRINPNGQALLNVLPLPNFTNRSVSGGAYNFISQSTANTPNRVDTWKNDYNIHSNDLLTFTWSAHYRMEQGYGTQSGVAWPWYDTTIHSRSLFYAWRYTHIFSPNMINELTVGANQHHGAYSIDPQIFARATYGYTLPQLYSASMNNAEGAIPRASFGGVPNASTIAFSYPPTNNDRELFDLSDNLTKIVGAHTFKFGVFVEQRWIDDGPQKSYPSGFFDFSASTNNPLSTGYSYANGILGNFNQYQEQETKIIDPEYRAKSIEWFAQDTWKVNRRLTIDYGIRLSWIQPWFDARNNRSSFVPSMYSVANAVQLIRPTLVNGVRQGISPVNGTIFPSADIGAIAPGAGNPTNGMVVAGTAGYPNAMADTPAPRPAVRFGFAYDPFGTGKTAIRGGFGMFYNMNSTYATNTLSTQYPILTTASMAYGSMTTMASTPGLVFPANVVGETRTVQLPMTMETSLSVQHQLGWGTVLDIGYVGTLGRHLMWRRPINGIPMGSDFLPQNADPTNPKVPLSSAFLEPYAGYGTISEIETAASSHYHGLQVSINRRFAKNVQLGANWTWSKAMGFNDDENVVLDALMPRNMDYGLDSFDRTHIFKFNWVYDLPQMFRSGPAKVALNDWHLSGIFSAMSGAPATVSFTTSNGLDITGSPSQTPRPNVVCNPYSSSGGAWTFSRNFNTSCFQEPAVGTFGNEGKYVLRGPGTNNWDLSLFKNFPIVERVHMEFRFEAYNTFNHPQFSAIDTSAVFNAAGQQTNADFGAFTTANRPRVLQLGLRATF